MIDPRGKSALACRVDESSEIPAFVAFAQTLRHDWDTAVAGVMVKWGHGPVEGLNNRIQLAKGRPGRFAAASRMGPSLLRYNRGSPRGCLTPCHDRI